MSGSSKALLLSILIMSVLIPAHAAGSPDPRLGLRRAIRGMVLFDLFYVFALVYVFPHL